MSCVYCQNYEINIYSDGNAVSNEALSNMMLSLQNNHGCHNINLVISTHFVPNVLEAIYLAAEKELELPILYNTSGYENVDTLKILDEVIDIYLPDFYI